MPLADATANRGEVEDYVAAAPLPHPGDGGADSSAPSALAVPQEPGVEQAVRKPDLTWRGSFDFD